MSISCLDDPQIPLVTYSGAPMSLPLGDMNLTRDLIPHSHTGSHHGACVVRLTYRDSTRDSPLHSYNALAHTKAHAHTERDLLQQIWAPQKLLENKYSLVFSCDKYS